MPAELLRRKRDGRELQPDEIAFLVRGVADGTLAESQVGAFAMAAWLKGLSPRETVALTVAMRDSGRVLHWDLPGPVLDKHSTGGVGDKVSLVLAPLVAACGGYVPMISGRGLGHTGGTLDKLSSIPGYDVTPDIARFERVVREAGCAIIGQTDDLAPADRRLYAIRDVTGTVESVPLITASILSKKLAAGLDGLVMDVKIGSGAFLPSMAAGRGLASSLVTVAEDTGLPCQALLTDMDQCLGRTAGNALETREALDLLTGAHAEPRLLEVTLALGAEMLVLGGLTPNLPDALARLREALASGRAAEHFARMAHGLGAPADLLERAAAYLPQAPLVRVVAAATEGHVTAIDVRALGLAVIGLGGGRTRSDQAIDPAVGLDAVAGLGSTMRPGTPLASIHARDEVTLARADAAVRGAFTVASEPPLTQPPVRERHLAGVGAA